MGTSGDSTAVSSFLYMTTTKSHQNPPHERFPNPSGLHPSDPTGKTRTAVVWIPPDVYRHFAQNPIPVSCTAALTKKDEALQRIMIVLSAELVWCPT